MAPLAELDQGRGLGVVDEHGVRFEVEHRGVPLVHLEIVLPHALRDVLAVALEGVVDLLRDLEEEGIAFDDLPFRLDTHAFEQGYHPLEYLGHPAPFPGRVDVQEPLPGEFFAEPRDEEKVALGRYVRVAGNHATTSLMSARSSCSTRRMIVSLMPSMVCMSGSMVLTLRASSFFPRLSSNQREKSSISLPILLLAS